MFLTSAEKLLGRIVFRGPIMNHKFVGLTVSCIGIFTNTYELQFHEVV